MTSRKELEEEWSYQKDRWGLSDWELKLAHQRRHLGYCKPAKKVISVSLQYMKLNPFSVMKDTLLHEIAHALHYIETGRMGHDKKWKEIARRVGCSPRRCASPDGLNVPPGKYTGVCSNCGKTVQFYRKVKRSYSCSACSPKCYDPRFKLEITKKGS